MLRRIHSAAFKDGVRFLKLALSDGLVFLVQRFPKIGEFGLVRFRQPMTWLSIAAFDPIK